MTHSPLSIPKPTTPRFLIPVIMLLSSFFLSFVSGTIFLSISNSSAASEEASVDVAFTVDPIISITTNAPSNVISIPITPTPSGTFGSGDLTVSIHTNNPTGYTLSMNSDASSTALTHTVTPTHTVPSTTATAASPQTLANDTWGYSRWSNGQVNPPTTFSSIPASSSPDTLTTTTDLTGQGDTKLTFGVRATSTIPAGVYVDTVVFTATTNYVAPPPQCPVLTGKTYLQDITAPTGPIYGQPNQRVVLKDRRNNQDYYVQNILNQDGSCIAWMETNLRYEGDGNYDPSWNYPDDRYATTTALAATTANPNDNTRPMTTVSGNDSSYYNEAQRVDPGGATDYTNTAAVGGFYGYLYNWCAAMGGQATACQNTTATQPDQSQSICPAGWRLPTGGIPDWDGDFVGLVDVVGATNDVAGSTNLRNNFLAVYSGYYDTTLYDPGMRGIWWSSTTATLENAYALHFNDTNVNLVNSEYKYISLAVRCVVQ